MNYTVDIAMSIMKNISAGSGPQPVLFQRDGCLYIASPQGFAQITFGVALEPQRDEKWTPKHAGTLPTNTIIDRDKDGKLQFAEGEEQYLTAISFGPDDDSFNLEDITTAAAELSKLPDDGKIRLISHDSRYHSHKFGYANDGTDVWVSQANVMDQEVYLNCIRHCEEAALTKFSDVASDPSSLDREIATARYSAAVRELPDCTIITPFMMVSLPRKGSIYRPRDVQDSWNTETALRQNCSKYDHGGVLHYGDIDTYKPSAFAVHIAMNSHEMRATGKESLVAAQRKIVQQQSIELDAVLSIMDVAERYVTNLNRLHDLACAGNIEWTRELHRTMAERHAAERHA